jgi:DNA-binding transcriptional ArsR family regulator
MPPKKNRKSKVKKGEEAVDSALVKALSHPVRARALSILNGRVASPKEIAAELGVSVGKVSYHVNQLKELECIEEVATAQRRGATEHFYRGITRSFLNDKNWAQLNSDAKTGVSIAGLKTQNAATLEALEAGTFDARADRHLSRTPLTVDEKGWTEVTELLAETLEGVMEIQTRSAARQAEEGTERIPATVSILSFESPPSRTEGGI